MLPNAAAIPPSQRVHFILGEEVEGEEGNHESHPLFSEMEELTYNHDAGEVEWNETARLVSQNILHLRVLYANPKSYLSCGTSRLHLVHRLSLRDLYSMQISIW